MEHGADNIQDIIGLLKGGKTGLITNPTGVNKELISTVDLLSKNLVCLFGPEHGIRAMIQDEIHVGHGTDPVTGLPEYSLFGECMCPTAEMLEQLDTLVFDIQDIGARFYTYAATMIMSMEAAWKYGKRFIVLDRANPLGRKVEGLVRGEEFESFLSYLPIPVRHGMTLGELASMTAAERFPGLDLHIVRTRGWNPLRVAKDMLWVPPSPNMPTLECACCYPGTCLVEGTSVSEGRGTTKPFELIGAPWLNAYKLAEVMNAHKLPGVLFRPAYFTPLEFKHKDIPCQGVQVHITDADALNSVWMGVVLIDELKRMSGENMSYRFLPEYGHYMIDLLHGDDSLRLGMPLDLMRAKMHKQSLAFVEKASPHYLY